MFIYIWQGIKDCCDQLYYTRENNNCLHFKSKNDRRSEKNNHNNTEWNTEKKEKKYNTNTKLVSFVVIGVCCMVSLISCKLYAPRCWR